MWVLSMLFLLSACQTATDGTRETDRHVRQKHHEAAMYNIQLGMAYLKQEDMPRAKRKLLTALTLAPNSPEVNAGMAYYLEKTGDLNEARVFYQKALSLAPNRGDQLNNYGTFLCRLGRYAEAERYFLKATKDINYLYTAAVYENAGLCVAAIPNYSKAKRYFIKALAQDPSRKQSLYELASIELKQKQANRALMTLQRYPNLFYNDEALLKMGIKAARKIGNEKLAMRYSMLQASH